MILADYINYFITDQTPTHELLTGSELQFLTFFGGGSAGTG